MSLSLNKVIIAGRLVGDPELKQTQNGISVTSIKVAIDRRVGKDAEKSTDFVPVVAWRSTAEFITRYFHKGSPICICGALQTRTWDDQYGNKRFACEVLADEAHFVESKSSGSAVPAAPVAPAQTPATPYSTAQQYEEMSNDDDLPF